MSESCVEPVVRGGRTKQYIYICTIIDNIIYILSYVLYYVKYLPYKDSVATVVRGRLKAHLNITPQCKLYMCIISDIDHSIRHAA